MAPSTNFLLIKSVIENTDKKAIHAYYEGDPAGTTRKLWPHVLGWSRTGPGSPDVEMVLCYQYDGYSGRPLATPHPKLKKNCRCFKVASLKDPANPTNSQVLVIDFDPINPPPPTGDTWEPKKFTFKQVKKQNCVDDVEVFR